MDINLKTQIDEARGDLQKLSVWLEGGGELELALAIKSMDKIVKALV